MAEAPNETAVEDIEHLDWAPGCEYAPCAAEADVAATLQLPCCGAVTKFLCRAHLECVIIDGRLRAGRPVRCRACGATYLFRWPEILWWEPIGGRR